MSSILRPSWFSYALSGVLAIVASWALSGCYFGNKTVNQPVQSDGVSGYYETQPQTLTLFASTPGEKQASVPVNQVPAMYSQFLTNPVILALSDPATGDAGIFPYPQTDGHGLAVTASTDGSLSFNPSPISTTLWDDPACTQEATELLTGTFTKTNGPWTSNTPTIPKTGRITLDITYTISIVGNCSVSLQAMADCYADQTKCGTHSQSDVAALFGPFISAAVMTSADISKVTGVAYEMTYK
jgi:hypothetical protein